MDPIRWIVSLTGRNVWLSVSPLNQMVDTC
ncbi:hypothetical protein D522_06180 [Mycobacterium avium subsp. paratuberculosis S5]|nr:hypothetical protein D522_06180 [Mycobacterium avium subsp. paratuberculosis S5]